MAADLKLTKSIRLAFDDGIRELIAAQSKQVKRGDVETTRLILADFTGILAYHLGRASCLARELEKGEKRLTFELTSRLLIERFLVLGYEAASRGIARGKAKKKAKRIH